MKRPCCPRARRHYSCLPRVCLKDKEAMRETQPPDAQLMQKKHKKEGRKECWQTARGEDTLHLFFFSAHLMTNTALTTNFASFNTKSLSSLGFFSFYFFMSKRKTPKELVILPSVWEMVHGSVCWKNIKTLLLSFCFTTKKNCNEIKLSPQSVIVFSQDTFKGSEELFSSVASSIFHSCNKVILCVMSGINPRYCISF